MYSGIIQKRKTYIKIGTFILGLYMIFYSFRERNFISCFLGGAVILATFSKREHQISEYGVDILFSIFTLKFHNLWKWSEIETIHIGSKVSDKNVELHIGKGVIGRRMVFKEEEIESILELAKEKNSKIFIAKMGRK